MAPVHTPRRPPLHAATRARHMLAALALVTAALPAYAAIPATERQALIDLYNSTTGDGWVRNNGWKTAGTFSAPGTECTWYGVSCDAGGNRVIGLNLNENNPVGPLPTSLNTLTALETLTANTGHLRGALPSFSGLTALREVSIQFQEFSSTIPDLSGLSALQTLYLNNNGLTGALPAVSGLSALRVFDVSHNRLSGVIPSLAGLPTLQVFVVHDNQLSGTPPAAPASLLADRSWLCPNLLHTPSPSDAAWDTATRDTPWSANCTPGYLVSGTADWGGRIGPPQGVQAGHTATLQVTPEPNFVIDTAFSNCGGTLVSNTFTTGPVNADCTVRASFRTAPGTITPSIFGTPLGGGSVRCTPAMPGETSTCTVTPAPGYQLQSIEGCGGTPSNTSPYTTEPLRNACMVQVRFAAAAVTPVPTLGQWALIGLGLLLTGLGARALRRPRSV